MRNKSRVEQADAPKSKANKIAKIRKMRAERRAAKADPECTPGYGFYAKYLS